MNGDTATPEQPQEPMVPMLAPDGSIGDVPQSRVSDAVKAGGRIGQEMLSPQGERGVIPLDRVHDAIHAGAQLTGGAPQQPVQPQELPESAWEKIKATIGSFFSTSPGGNPERQSEDIGNVQKRSDEYGKAFGFAAGGGLTKLGEEGAVIATPVLARVAKKFLGDSETVQKFIEALHGETQAEGTVEEMAHGPEPAEGAGPTEPTAEETAAAEQPDLPRVPKKVVKQSQALAPDAQPQQQAEALKTANTPAAEPDPSLNDVPADELEEGQNLESEVEGTPKPKSQTGNASSDVKAQGKVAAETSFLKHLGVTKEDIAAANAKGKIAYQKHLTQQALKGAKFGERGGVTPELMESAKAASRAAYLKHLGITEAELEAAKGAARQGFMDHYNKSMNELTSALKAKSKK